ncbi:MAG: nucleotidyltransferase domain-containing protein [Candidatus Thorarchaeota archaeon]|nr:nucleotidyltransferase domain-containing protein [Candidatus Thorarchaeota archaeon]
MPRLVRSLVEREGRLTEGFEDFVCSLGKTPGIRSAAVLYGSRADGTASLLSDFDLLWIVEGEPDRDAIRREAVRRGVDLFLVTVSELNNALENHNSIVLDALTRGRVLFDTLDMIPSLKEQVRRLIEAHGLVRTEVGWTSVIRQ